MIAPSIGRIVWYWPSAYDRARVVDPIPYIDSKQPMAGLVTYVHDERHIDLAVHDHSGWVHSRTLVPLLQDEDEKPANGDGYAQWMPYQVGQAAKATT